jgi:hypothetical protein
MTTTETTPRADALPTRVVASPEADRAQLARRILDAAEALLESRPGIEPGNYATRADLSRDYYQVAADLRLGRALLAEARLGADVDRLLGELPGRVRLWGAVDEEGRVAAVVSAEYCAGQYYCTEYRAAVVGWLVSVVARAWAGDAPPYTPERRARLIRRFGRRLAGWL